MVHIKNVSGKEKKTDKKWYILVLDQNGTGTLSYYVSMSFRYRNYTIWVLSVCIVNFYLVGLMSVKLS